MPSPETMPTRLSSNRQIRMTTHFSGIKTGENLLALWPLGAMRVLGCVVGRAFDPVFLPHMLHSRPFNMLIDGLSFFEQSTLPQGLRHVLVNMTRMLLNPCVKFPLVSSEKCWNAIMAARRLI